jgi:hypothetical protein
MSEHSVFAFSASPRWIPCPGSMAYPENTADRDAGKEADEGSAAHALGSDLLTIKGLVPEHRLGQVIKIGKREFTVTEDFFSPTMDYVEDVRRRALGGFLRVEQRVTLKGVEGFDETNYGTSDAIIAQEGNLGTAEGPYGVVEDLKFGKGVKVYAWLRATPESLFTFTRFTEEDGAIEVEPNYQLMMYALAALKDITIFVGRPKFIMLVIHQPRLGHVSELRVPIAVLERFALFAADAYSKAEAAMGMGVAYVEKTQGMLNPGEKQCRWCQAQARCPALKAKLQADVGAEFDDLTDSPNVTNTPKAIAKAMNAIPLLALWMKSVMAQANSMVAGGVDIIGPDGKPYKFIEGKQGDRKWKDEAAAAEALVAQLGEEKAYTPRKVVSVAVAAKILDKKKTAHIWENFADMYKRAPGKPTLVYGSDPRPPYTPAATSDEFDVEDEE